MKKVDLLQDLMAMQTKDYFFRVVGDCLYFSLNDKNFAVAELIASNKANNYDGIKISCVSKEYGLVHKCNLMFSDIFEESNSSIACIMIADEGGYKWYKEPDQREKLTFSDHIAAFFDIISEMNVSRPGNTTFCFPYFGVSNRTLFAAPDFNPQLINKEAYIGDSQIFSLEENTKNNEESLESVKEDNIEMPESTAENVVIEQIVQTFTNEDAEETVLSDDERDENSNEMIATNINDDNESFADINEEIEDDVVNESTTSVDSSTLTPQSFQAENLTEPINNDSSDEKNNGNLPKARSKKIFGALFSKKDKRVEAKKPKRKSIEELLAEDENITDDKSVKDGFILTWNIGFNNPEDVISVLKKIEDDFYELHITGKGRMLDFLPETTKLPWHDYMNNIVKVIVYDGVKNIGNCAFKSCKELRSVELSDSIKIIGESAFEYCSSLEAIRFSKNLEIIADFAFSGCEQISSISLPDKVMHIGDYGFEFDANPELVIHCKDPNNLVLGDGLHRNKFIKLKDKQEWFLNQQKNFK